MTTRKAFALIAYPLSHEFRDELEGSVDGEIEYLHVPQLRRLGPRGLLSALASLRGRRCLIPLEDPSSASLRPVLQAIAAVALPASIEIVHPDLSRERVSRLQFLPMGVRLGRASLQGMRSRRATAARLGALLDAPRVEAEAAPGRRIVSLNANLWFGVKAGGSLAHTAGVANALAKAGHDVHLIAPFAVPHLHEGVVEHLVLPPRAFAVPTEVNYFRHDDALVERISDLAAATRPRFLYQRLSIHSHAGARLSRQLSVPLVLEYNGSEVWVARHWGRPLRYEELAEQAEDVLLRHAHVIVTVSNVLRDELLARGLEARRIVTYPNCVDTDLFDPARFDDSEVSALRARLGIPDDALVATFVGTFGRWHGTDILARAIRALVEDAPAWLKERKLHFLLVGDGLRMPEVEGLLGGRKGRFHTLAGLVPQAETPRYLAASDLVLSPHVANEDRSPFFGSPTKLFEYMAMRLPIVASELDQIGEVLQPSVHVADLRNDDREPGAEVAVLATPGSPQELAAGIRLLVEKPHWRAALGENARGLALQRYTWDAHVAAILERVEELCG